MPCHVCATISRYLWYNNLMKKHAIIPVFIPHRGCPNDCVFCNQKAITARSSDVSPEDVRNTIETYLPTLTGRGLETIELAFFGGSFTGLSIAEQSAFLTVAKEYKDAGLIDKIHMSTRPDYIDRDDPGQPENIRRGHHRAGRSVLRSRTCCRASNRGHTVQKTSTAPADLIKSVRL